LFHQQKFQRAKQELEKVLEGPSKELADRARTHLRITEQRMKPLSEQNPKSPEEHYQRGVAMMNLGRWDEARESLDKARKLAPKADHVHYALAALDCLTGKPIPPWPTSRSPSSCAPPTATTRVTTRTLRSSRKTPASRNCCILKRTATRDSLSGCGSPPRSRLSEAEPHVKRSRRNKSLQSRGLRVVALGGGTGLSALLRGLKEHVVRRTDRHASGERPIADLAAIVTVTDDGGSSGRLRRENRMLPPGDIRNCMVALSKDEALLGRLFQYRFHAGRGLIGHNFGNLFLAALTHVTGDFAEAVHVSSKVLAIRGRIFPSTVSNVHLTATLANGELVSGETKISRSRVPIRQIQLVPRRVRALP